MRADDVIAGEPTLEILRALDRGLSERVLVFGSLPPHGRDVDLLVPEEATTSIASALREAGLTRSGELWLAFRECTVVAVELLPAAGVGLPKGEMDALFAESSPLRGLRHIVEPAPHHAILILARRLARQSHLSSKHRSRIDDALTRDERAWERARSRVALWSAEESLAQLEGLYQRPASAPHSDREGRRRRWTRFLTLTGPSPGRVERQARALVGTLDRLGLTAIVTPSPPAWRDVWPALGRVDVVLLTATSRGEPPGPRTSRSRRVLGVRPRSRRMYLLDDATAGAVPPGIEAPIDGVRRFGAELSDEALCKAIAEDAWEALSRPTRLESVARAFHSGLPALRRREKRAP